jgi:hypothetical protein
VTYRRAYRRSLTVLWWSGGNLTAGRSGRGYFSGEAGVLIARAPTVELGRNLLEGLS